MKAVFVTWDERKHCAPAPPEAAPAPGMHTEEPRGGALLENCTDAVPATGNGSAWVLAAATNLGSVSLQPQWAMSGEWAEQIMGRTWSLSMSEYVIGT